MEPMSFSFRIEDFDLKLLPIDAGLLKSDAGLLVEAITQYFVDAFAGLGGQAQIFSDEKMVNVNWTPVALSDTKKLLTLALALLRKGAYAQAEPLLLALFKKDAADADVLYNYGMMLSDLGRTAEAVRMLKDCVRLNPGRIDALNALGVAQVRGGNRKEGMATLEKCIALAPHDPSVLRNYGGLLLGIDAGKALPYLKQAVELQPDDQQGVCGYAEALLLTGDSNAANVQFKKVIEIAPYTGIAEKARTQLTILSQENMKDSVGGNVRMDVVLYCVEALKLFKVIGREKAKQITLEIALLARDGLAINSPDKKYALNIRRVNSAGCSCSARCTWALGRLIQKWTLARI